MTREPEASGNADHPPPDRPAQEASLVARLEAEELERRLETARRKERRHMLWAVLGISPAAIIPALGLLSEASFGLLFLLFVLVTLSEGIAWNRASRKAKRLEAQVRLHVEHPRDPLASPGRKGPEEGS